MSYPGHSLGGEVLLLCRDAVGVFYSSSWLESKDIRYENFIQYDWKSCFIENKFYNLLRTIIFSPLKPYNYT